MMRRCEEAKSEAKALEQSEQAMTHVRDKRSFAAMANSFMDNELFELFLFETGQLIGQIEQALLIGEQTSAYIRLS